MDPARAAELLARERARIERELKTLRPESDEELSHVDQHLADLGTELYEDERDEGLADRLREELAAIERAERRLKEGTYGRSIISGEPIPDGRLEAVPWAELTVEQQSRREGGA
jgi:DnaK suppressor protein